MKHVLSRRQILVASVVTAAAATVVATTGNTMADEQVLHGRVSYMEGAALPKGRLRFHVEGLPGSASTKAIPLTADMVSDGKADRLSFSMSLPEGVETAPVVLLVVSLERPDGWLLARGTAKVRPGEPVDITLFEVVY